MGRRSLFAPRGQGPSITPPPDFRWAGIATGGTDAFLTTSERLTLTRQACRSDSVARGQVLFLESHGAAAAPLSGFYYRCCPRRDES